jgi:hypothetical protein
MEVMMPGRFNRKPQLRALEPEEFLAWII